MNLKQFTGLLIGSSIAIFYSIATAHYYDEQSRTNSTLISTFERSIIDLNFVLSQQNADGILTSRNLLNRKLVTNNYIKAITIYDGNTPKIYTNHKYIDKPRNILDITKLKYSNILDGVHYIKSDLIYYNNWEQKEYTIVYTLDTLNINQHRHHVRIEFILLFLLLPGILVIITISVYNRYIFVPLSELLEYTTTDGVCIPRHFEITELEILRQSTVSSFEQLKLEKKELRKLSRTDTLTLLDNRNALTEKVDTLIEQNQTDFALLFIDVDHFKSINDSLGHNAGDKLLQSLGKMFVQATSSDDIVSRIGGDEFIIVLTSYSTEEKLERLVHNILKVASGEIVIDGNEMKTSISIGIAQYPEHGDTLEGLMQKADIALFKAKDKGRNQHVYFDNIMFETTQNMIRLNQDMLSGLLNKEYELYYQPQTSTKNNKIIGAEALIRWYHNDTFILPNEFIPLAEKTEFIIDLGWWIIIEALKEKMKWEAQGLNITLSINIAAKQFNNKEFYTNLKFYLDRFKVNTSQITLEITEYIFLFNDKKLLKTFNKIKKLGITISLDDFGTGYSSLAYLKKFPIDVIKIDKSFVDDYQSEEGQVFLETIIKMAKNLNIGLVAEGVEEQAQLDMLINLDCEKYQGYLCSRPLPTDKFLEFVKDKV